jgi:hypothetical protein
MDKEASVRELDERLEKNAALLVVAARCLPMLDVDERSKLVERALSFLHRDVGAHLADDAAHLYPAVAERLRDPLATAPLQYEHRAIRWWIDELARADPADTNDLQRLLYGLYALITVHLSREEELYADAVDSRRWPASGDTVLA